MDSIEARVIIEKATNDPVWFCEHILGVHPWEKQAEVLLSIRDNPKTCVASGHGVGKTFTAACAVLWFLSTRPGSRIITTAPTARQVESILWAEIANLYRQSKFPLGGKLIRTALTFSEKHFAIGLSTDEPDRFQGHHAENLLLVMDEAPGVDPKIYEAAQGILTSRGAKVLLIGNPTSPSGPFFEAFKNDLWNKIFISCYDSPGVTNPDSYPTLTTLEWIEERKNEWGEDSPIFQARVLGQFPVEGEDTLIPLNWCEKAIQRWEKKEDACRVTDRMYMGLDVARYGDNKTVLVEYCPHRIEKIVCLQGKNTTESVKMVIPEALQNSEKLMQITVDDTGVGGGITDRLRELGYPTIGINFANFPTDRIHFANIRSEMYWNMRELFRTNEIAVPNNVTLMSQLSALKYKIDLKGRIVVETKDDLKKRGLKSPDEADAVALAIYGYKRSSGSSMTRRTLTRKNDTLDVAYY